MEENQPVMVLQDDEMGVETMFHLAEKEKGRRDERRNQRNKKRESIREKVESTPTTVEKELEIFVDSAIGMSDKGKILNILFLIQKTEMVCFCKGKLFEKKPGDPCLKLVDKKKSEISGKTKKPQFNMKQVW